MIIMYIKKIFLMFEEKLKKKVQMKYWCKLKLKYEYKYGHVIIIIQCCFNYNFNYKLMTSYLLNNYNYKFFKLNLIVSNYN